MVDRVNWYDLVILDSLILSKKLLPGVNYMRKFSTIKIRVQFSRRQTRSIVLMFWCLFIALGPYLTRTADIQEPLKKIGGLGARQGVYALTLKKRADIHSFLDLWTTDLATTNLIFLRTVKLHQTGALLEYGKTLRPSKSWVILKHDPAIEYFLAKAGVFTVLISFSEFPEQVELEDLQEIEEVVFALNCLGLYDF